jgi:hypothetical protein
MPVKFSFRDDVVDFIKECDSKNGLDNGETLKESFMEQFQILSVLSGEVFVSFCGDKSCGCDTRNVDSDRRCISMFYKLHEEDAKLCVEGGKITYMQS